MKKYIFISTILITLALKVNANITNNYQYSDFPENSIITIKPITNDAITLNPDIDKISSSDPRIKSLIDYVKANGLGISVVFFKPDNLRYVKKINELFQANHIYTDLPQLSKTKNQIGFNLIKIYVIEDKSNDLESTSQVKSKYK